MPITDKKELLLEQLRITSRTIAHITKLMEDLYKEHTRICNELNALENSNTIDSKFGVCTQCSVEAVTVDGICNTCYIQNEKAGSER